LYFAVWWGGGVVVPFNTRWSIGEIAHALDHCDTRLLVVDETFGPYVLELSERSRSLRTVIHAGDQPTPSGMFDYEQLISDHEPIADSMRHDDDLAAVFYTGGTTGLPTPRQPLQWRDECAVVGIPDRHWGEAVHALIVCKPDAAGVDADAIKAHCHSLIAGYKCPRSVEFRDSLPMSGTGKVLKHALREPYWRDQPRRVG
jgi:acyl-CoA synthetase (AMP-forming)/AMP-acid ligase II